MLHIKQSDLHIHVNRFSVSLNNRYERYPRDGSTDTGLDGSKNIVSLCAWWLSTAVGLAENEKFDCNLGLSHYSLNAVEVFFGKEGK